MDTAGMIYVGLIAMLLGIAIFLGFSKQQMKAECLTWQAQAREYTNYYLTDWQEDQCEDVGVEIILQ